jgi:D-alanine transaminase
MDKILYNEAIMPRQKLIDIEDRAYQFGDGVYEVIGIYEGIPFMMDEHLERLERSAKEVRLNLPYDRETLKSKLTTLVKENSLLDGVIYLQVSRGIAERWHQFPSEDVAPVLVAYTKLESTMKEEEDQGASAILTEDIRWHRCDIKTLNLLPNVLAKQKAVENQAIEAIMHRGDTITEASASNVFIVKNEEVYTHPANDYILNGITRRNVISLFKEKGIPVNEETFTVDELLQADEVFITATKLDIVPIIQVDGKQIGTGKPGEITKALIQSFRKTVNDTVHVS